MFTYWLLFILPALASIGDQRLTMPVVTWNAAATTATLWLAIGVGLAIVIGYRFQVGGDWFSYLGNLHSLRGNSLIESLQLADPGYQFLGWLSLELGWGVIGVNLMSGLIFAAGLCLFCRAMPQPALALAVAMPYLVTVVAMGYTRQGVALGFAMAGLLALQRSRISYFLLLIFLGATFHKSAVLLLPIAALAATKNRFWTLIWAAVVTFLAYDLLLESALDNLVTNYIDAEYQSEGALVRLGMNAVPAAILLRWRHNFFPDRIERNLWTLLALISLGLFAVYFLTPASTAVDRIALYMLPLQLVVFSRVPIVFGGAKGAVRQWTLMVLGYYALVLLIWLNFAVHARYWVPYRFYPWEVMLGNVGVLP